MARPRSARRLPVMTVWAKEAGIPTPSTLWVLQQMAAKPDTAHTNTRMARALGLNLGTVCRATAWMAENNYASNVGTAGRSTLFKLTEDGIALANLAGPVDDGEEPEPEPAPSELAELRAMIESLNGKVAQLGMMPSGQAEPEPATRVPTIEEVADQVVELLAWIADQRDAGGTSRMKVLQEILREVIDAQEVVMAQSAEPNPPVLVAVPDPPKPQPNGKPCSNCGISDHDCWHRGVNGPAGLPCCGRCGHTATHGQDDPGYIPPYPTASRGGSGGRAS